MTRKRSTLALLALLLLGGCDRLFGLTHVAPVDAAPPDAVPPSIALVQQMTAGMAMATTVTVTLPAAPASGNVLVMIGASDRSTLAPPTGGGVAAWRRSAASVLNANVEIWYGISDGSSSAITIACACSIAGNMRASVSEWSGLTAMNLFEAGGDMSGATTTAALASPGTITTIDGPNLIVFGVSSYGPISSSATGSGTWTALDSVSVESATQSAWYQVDPAQGSYAPTVMVDRDWDAVIAAFRGMP